MRLRIDGKRTPLAPQLLGRIAERLEHLNNAFEDICHARVLLVQPEEHLQDYYEARVTLLLESQVLHATRGGATPASATNVALKAIERAVHGLRTRQQLLVH